MSKLSIEELEEMRPTLQNLRVVADQLDYDDLDHFFGDNEGAIESVMNWLMENHQLFGIEGFREGERVLLLANPEEGWPEEHAVVLAYEGRGVYLVEVESPRSEEDPDGFREVDRDQMRRINPEATDKVV